MDITSAARRSSTATAFRLALPLLAIFVGGAYLGALSLSLVAVTAVPRSATPAATQPSAPVSEAASAKPSSATPSPTPSAQYPEVYGLPDGQECSRSGTGPWSAVAVNSTTSCAFAENVRRAYDLSGLDGSVGTVEAFSPTTKLEYVLTCRGSQPAVCTGGRNVEIQIYGGEYADYTPE